MVDEEPVPAPQRKRFPVGSVIILAITIILMLLLVQITMNNDFYDEFGRDVTKENWIFGISLVMILFIIILLVGGFPAKRAQPQFTSQGQMMPVAPPIEGVEPGLAVVGTEVASAEMSVVEAEPLVVEAEIVEAEPIEAEEVDEVLKTKKPRLIEYPKKVPGGVYGDTIVRVDPRTKLNLRTLLVRSCMICDRQGKCWEEIQDAIPRDLFLDNIECKKGLRHLKGEGETAKRKVKKVRMKVRAEEQFSNQTAPDNNY